MKRFRNNLRLSRAHSRPSHAVFATLQGESDTHASETDAPQTRKSSKADKKPPKCICNEAHLFRDCPYLISQKRPQGWVADEQIQKQISEKLAQSPKLKAIIGTVRRQATKQSSDATEAKQATPATPPQRQQLRQQQLVLILRPHLRPLLSIRAAIGYEIRGVWTQERTSMSVMTPSASYSNGLLEERTP